MDLRFWEKRGNFPRIWDFGGKKGGEGETRGNFSGMEAGFGIRGGKGGIWDEKETGERNLGSLGENGEFPREGTRNSGIVSLTFRNEGSHNPGILPHSRNPKIQE